MKRHTYFPNLWHAIRGTPNYVPARGDTQRVNLEVNTADAIAQIENLQAKVDKLRGSIEALNDELGLIQIPRPPDA